MAEQSKKKKKNEKANIIITNFVMLEYNNKFLVTSIIIK